MFKASHLFDNLFGHMDLLTKRRHAISTLTFIVCILVMLGIFGLTLADNYAVTTTMFVWGLIICFLIALGTHIGVWLYDIKGMTSVNHYGHRSEDS
jgi:cyanate permease